MKTPWQVHGAPWSGVLSRWLVAAAVVFMSLSVQGQVPFPPQALIDATSQQQAVAVLGAAQAERSGYLLIDAPDVVAPGPYTVKLNSEIAGTTHLVLLRVSLLSPSDVPPVTPEKVTVFAKRFAPGQAPVGSVEIGATSRQGLILFAYARGRWYVTSRDVKLGKAVQLP